MRSNVHKYCVDYFFGLLLFHLGRGDQGGTAHIQINLNGSQLCLKGALDFSMNWYILKHFPPLFLWSSTQGQGALEAFTDVRKGYGKKKRKCLVFYQTGVSEGRKNKNHYLGKVFFQWAYRIILRTPKHVLHLVPSNDAIAKAFNVM